MLAILRNVTYRQCVLKLAKISRYFIPDIKNEQDAVLVVVEVNYLILIHREFIYSIKLNRGRTFNPLIKVLVLDSIIR